MAVIKTVILKLKDGRRAEDIIQGSGRETVLKLNDILKAAPGYLQIYHGAQLEDPSIFIWVIHWATFEDHVNFEKHPLYKDTFMPLLATLFDVGRGGGPPLKFVTQFNTDPSAPLTSPVTEFALFALPKDTDSATKAKFQEAAAPFLHAAVSVGGAHGNSLGWITDDTSAPDLGQHVVHAVIGYPSLEAHQTFQKLPEHDALLGPVLEEFKCSPVSLDGKAPFHVSLQSAWAK